MEMLNFFEEVTDKETGEKWFRELPACKCSECGGDIYKDDECYLLNNGAPICEECMSWKKMTGKEALRAMMRARKGA